MFKICKTCNLSKALDKFPSYNEPRKKGLTRNTCSACKGKKAMLKRKASPALQESYKQTQKKYYEENTHLYKLKAYQHSDKKLTRETISKPEFEALIKNNSCFYCNDSELKNLGLDRVDNNLGHCASNVRVCCEKCNNILGDLPDSAKLILKDSLFKIKQLDLLNKWIIPTKRGKND